MAREEIVVRHDSSPPEALPHCIGLGDSPQDVLLRPRYCIGGNRSSPSAILPFAFRVARAFLKATDEDRASIMSKRESL